MLRRLTGLALAALLLLPGAAMAADPSPVPPATIGHYYHLVAIEAGGTMVKTEGKLWIEGGKLGVSVGCNSIGAAVTFDGKTLAITGGISTTEMGCPPELAPAEAALVKALAAGPFTWDGNAFNGNGARLTATELTTSVTPATPPDAVVVDPGMPFDPVVCRDFVSADEWAAVFGGGDSVGVTGSGTAVAPGSVPGSGPAAGSGSSSASGSGGSGTTGTAGAGATTQVAPAPVPAQTAGARPLGTPATNAVPPSTGIAVALPAVDLPLPSGATTVPAPITKDAPAVMPGPGATPSAELCRELLARISVMVSNGMAMPKAGIQATLGAGLMEGDMATARDAAGTPLGGPAAAVLALVVGLLLVAWMRSLASTPAGRTER